MTRQLAYSSAVSPNHDPLPAPTSTPLPPPLAIQLVASAAQFLVIFSHLCPCPKNVRVFPVNAARVAQRGRRRQREVARKQVGVDLRLAANRIVRSAANGELQSGLQPRATEVCASVSGETVFGVCETRSRSKTPDLVTAAAPSRTDVLGSVDQ